MIKEYSSNKWYEKLYKTENIEIGDLISLDPISNRIKLAFNKFNKEDKLVIRNMY